MSEEDNGVEVVIDEAKKPDNDEPVVEIIDEKPEQTAKKAQKTEVTPDDGISELKKSLEKERQARLDAEQRAQKAFQQAQQAKVEKSDSDYQLVVNAIETVKGQSEQLKAAYAEAMSAQDYARAAEVQAALNLSAQQLSDLKKGKKAMKEAREAAERQPQPMAPQGDMVDQLASQVSARSAAWLRDSRDHLKSERDIRKMYRAHEDAIDDGIAPDSDEYFEFIEQRLGIRKNMDEGDSRTSAEAPMSHASAPKRSAPPPAAPVSRGGQRANVMRLSAAEADTARSLGMTPEEYAKNKVLLQKEGRYGH